MTLGLHADRRSSGASRRRPRTIRRSSGIPAGGGFDFECKWTNTGSTAVKFGESANDEMCFFWAYYYPSQGAKVCIHTEQYGGAAGIDICCPATPTICALICEPVLTSGARRGEELADGGEHGGGDLVAAEERVPA